jgi:hypothetical protein
LQIFAAAEQLHSIALHAFQDDGGGVGIFTRQDAMLGLDEEDLARHAEVNRAAAHEAVHGGGIECR